MQLRNTVHKSLTEFKVELKELQEELSLWRQRLTLPVQRNIIYYNLTSFRARNTKTNKT